MDIFVEVGIVISWDMNGISLSCWMYSDKRHCSAWFTSPWLPSGNLI